MSDQLYCTLDSINYIFFFALLTTFGFYISIKACAFYRAFLAFFRSPFSIKTRPKLFNNFPLYLSPDNLIAIL